MHIKGKNGVVRAVAYARFSSDNQRDESIDAQLRAIHEYANKNNIIIISEYIDRARSAMTDNRPEFLGMIKDSLNGDFDVVLIHKLDRFARNRYDSAYYSHQLKKNNVKLISVIENIDDSPEGIMITAVLEGMAEYYSQNLAREVRKGMHENALKGMHTGGKPPLGYDVDPETKKLVMNEVETEIVRYIFKEAIAGVGYNTIVHELNMQECRTKLGKKFTKNSLHTILSNEKYCGTYIFNKSVSADVDGKRNSHRYKDDNDIIRLENSIQQIIDKEVFLKMQEKMQKRKKEFIGHKAIETYLLTSKIICGKCGGTYCGYRRKDGRNKNLIVRYGCNKRQRQGKSGCDNKDIRREYIEALVLDELSQNIFDEKLLPLIYAQFTKYNTSADTEQTKTIQVIHSQIQIIEKDIESVVNLLIQTSSKTLLERLETLENDKAAFEQKLYNIKAVNKNSTMSYGEMIALFNGAKAMFKDGSLKSIKRLIELFVEFVAIHDESVEIKFSFNKNNPNDLNEIDSHGHNFNQTNLIKTAKKPVLSGLSDVLNNTYWRGGGEGN